MKPKRSTFFLCLLSLFCLLPVIEMKCQLLEPKDSTKIENREFYSYATIGIIEYYALGIGYQIDENFSVGIKYQSILVETSGGGSATGFVMAGATGIGITVSRYFSGNLFNSIKLSFTPLFSSSEFKRSDELFKGSSFECTFNNEKLLSSIFKFYYELGVGVVNVQEKNTLIAPSIKFGMIYNF